ncbi:MAG: hypothetical protein QOH06_1251 [Acidobacteriota bacterium]|jgi:hypothetical protein|nr:hypothetical protein [Acidobacteriota bacterium]
MNRNLLVLAVVTACAFGCGTLGTENKDSSGNSEEMETRAGKSLIILKTADVYQAGTDSSIQARLRETDPWITLDNPGNDRERGDEDYYWVQFPPAVLGTNLYLRTNSRGVAPSWKVSWVEVNHPQGPKEKKVWNMWLGSGSRRGTWCDYTQQGPISCP